MIWRVVLQTREGMLDWLVRADDREAAVKRVREETGVTGRVVTVREDVS